ncbi:protein kinase family protein [bacterium]|nr:MAG: protein kinase family protein [bacterium]
MLGDGAGVNAAHIGDDDIAFHHGGREHTFHTRSGALNPIQGIHLGNVVALNAFVGDFDLGQKFDARRCLENIAAGISHFHSLGVVHSDIKPDNIFVDLKSSGRPIFVVGDFDSTHEFGAVCRL